MWCFVHKIWATFTAHRTGAKHALHNQNIPSRVADIQKSRRVSSKCIWQAFQTWFEHFSFSYFCTVELNAFVPPLILPSCLWLCSVIPVARVLFVLSAQQKQKLHLCETDTKTGNVFAESEVRMAKSLHWNTFTPALLVQLKRTWWWLTRKLSWVMYKSKRLI